MNTLETICWLVGSGIGSIIIYDLIEVRPLRNLLIQTIRDATNLMQKSRKTIDEAAKQIKMRDEKIELLDKILDSYQISKQDTRP